MALIHTDNVTVSFGALRVLDAVSLDIQQGERVGLVGMNGSGKTTLLRVIAGAQEPDSGRVEGGRRTRIGFMEQEPDLRPEDSVHDAALSAFSDLWDIEHRMRALEHEIASAQSERRHDLLARLGALQQRFEHEGGYDCESRVAAVLMGLGMSQEVFSRPVSVISGGERSRVALARLLLREPELLILDEPTNHLDLEGIEWLESFLAKKFRGTLLMVSHDRTFLDRTVTRIAELDRGHLAEYSGNYSKFVLVKEQQRCEQQRLHDAQQAFIEKEESFIRRYHADQRAREARGRRKRLERIERIDAPERDQKISVRFDPARQSGEVCLRAENLGKSFGEKRLFRDLSFEVERGERIGIIGPNGSGKTTLLRVLLGEDAPDDGSIERGHHVHFGYLKQYAEELSTDRTVLDEVWERKRSMNEVEVRNVLGQFLFSGDDAVMKRMCDLSGGERTRVALACLIVDRPNVLVLDEPTNHLDIASREALETALLGYAGTIVAVSHDRYFLNRVVEKIIALENGGARVIHGNYEDYERIKAEAAQEVRTIPAAKSAPEKRKRTPGISKNRLAQLEKGITELEAERDALEAELARPDFYADPDRARETPRRYQEVRDKLDVLYQEWMAQDSDAG